KVAELCAREKCSVRHVNMTISLAFLAPNLVKAAVEGRLPRGIGVERLRDPPTEKNTSTLGLESSTRKPCRKNPPRGGGGGASALTPMTGKRISLTPSQTRYAAPAKR